MINDWDLSVNWDTAKDMLDRAKRYIPELLDPDVRIKKYNVGLRPARKDGPRVETELYLWPNEKSNLNPASAVESLGTQRKTIVLHAYGFGFVPVGLIICRADKMLLNSAAGYQQSWGAAEEAVELLKNALDAQ
jgi:D-amino-acid oxidase